MIHWSEMLTLFSGEKVTTSVVVPMRSVDPFVEVPPGVPPPHAASVKVPASSRAAVRAKVLVRVRLINLTFRYDFVS
jgi:hypothetical protein